MTWTDAITLDGRPLTDWVAGATTDASCEWTTEGAPTLSINTVDRGLRLLRGGLLDRDQDEVMDRGVVASYQDTRWRLVQARRQPAGRVPLTFEDETVELLRRHSEYRRASRDDGTTRAEFWLSLLQEVQAREIDWVIPELHRTQPVAKSKPTGRQSAAERAAADRRRDAGFADHAKITVKRHKADGEQRGNLEVALRAAAARNPPRLAVQALVVAMTQESECRNLPGDGVLQVTPATARHYGISPRDVPGSARGFLDGYNLRPGAIELATKNPRWTPGQVAVEVQRPADRSERPYQRWADEAAKTVDAFDGGAHLFAREVEDHDTYFERGRPGEPEDSWDCGQRLAREVAWRCFVVQNVSYFVSDTRLMRSRPRLLIAEQMPGVESIEWEVDSGRRVSTATVKIRTDKPLIAPPGSVVELAEEGIASGRWLTGKVRQERLASNLVTLELRKPVRPKKEPAPQSYTSTYTRASAESSGGSSNGVPDSVRRAYDEAKRIDRRGYAYSYSGGHNASFSGPYDCSGLVSALLHAGGLLDVAQGTSGLVRWGVAGRGQFMTVWVKETGNPKTSHTFVTMDLNQDGDLVYVEAGGGESGHTGFHRPRSTAGFVPRHAPGT